MIHNMLRDATDSEYISTTMCIGSLLSSIQQMRFFDRLCSEEEIEMHCNPVIKLRDAGVRIQNGN